MENVRRKLDKLREDVTNIVYEACIKALHEVGYTIDDSNITIDQTAYGKLGRLATEFEMPNDDFLQMSFIEQVSKREKCRRLSWYKLFFIYNKYLNKNIGIYLYFLF